MKADLISIIVPVYRVEKYLDKCIESIRNQTYKNIEIILINDGSDDACPEKCIEYGQRDSRIKVIHQENRGLSAARNAGLEKASGEYIAFVDSDDYVSQYYIERMYQVAIAEKCDIVQCRHETVYGECAVEDTRIGTPMIFLPKEYSAANYTSLGWSCVVAWNKLYSKKLFEGLRYPEGKIHEDEYITYKLVWAAERVGVINMKLYFYRKRADSIMGNAYSLKRLDAWKALREKELFFKEQNEKIIEALVQRAFLYWVETQKFQIEKNFPEQKDIIVQLAREKKRLMDAIDAGVYQPFQEEGMVYLFPFVKIPYNCKIVIYGAGKVGRSYFKQVTKTNYCDVIGWVDDKWDYYREWGYPVNDKNSLLKFEFDYIIIANANEKIAIEIMEELLTVYEIPINKIVYDIIC